MKLLNASKTLFLADFASLDISAVREWMVKEFRVASADVEKYQVLVGCLDDGSWEASAMFVLRCRETGNYFEIHAEHCSCYGFENQFTPEPTTIKYLKSDKFGARGFHSLMPQISEFLKTL